jgi:hypothetical protein
MKRKVKFQEGGEVPPENPARNRRLRTIMDGFRNLGQADRAAAQRFIEQFNERPEVRVANERTTANVDARRMPVPSGGGSGPPALPPSSNVPMMPEGGGRGVPAGQGGAMVPRPRPDFSNIMREGLSATGRAPTSGRPPMGGGPGAAASALGLVAPLVLERAESYLRPRFEEAQTRRAADQEAERQVRIARMEAERGRVQDRADMEREVGEAGNRRPAAAPPRSRPQARPQGRRELTADELNAMVLERLGAEQGIDRAEGPTAAVARERIGQRMGEPYKKGGMVQPKAAPKKMMRGGVVAKPKVAAKKGKPMPFKKGGPVKKAKGGMIGKGCK